MFHQLISLLGAAMILGAYFAYQRGQMGRENPMFNGLNFVGTALLAWVAVVDRRWGFIVLESIWALISLGALLRLPRRK